MRTRLGATFVLALRAMHIQDRGSPQDDACGMQAIEWLGFRQGIVFSASVLPRSLVVPRRSRKGARKGEFRPDASGGKHRFSAATCQTYWALRCTQRRLEPTSFLRKNPLAMFSHAFHPAGQTLSVVARAAGTPSTLHGAARWNWKGFRIDSSTPRRSRCFRNQAASQVSLLQYPESTEFPSESLLDGPISRRSPSAARYYRRATAVTAIAHPLLGSTNFSSGSLVLVSGAQSPCHVRGLLLGSSRPSISTICRSCGICS
jgi:hypothetical protein